VNLLANGRTPSDRDPLNSAIADLRPAEASLFLTHSRTNKETAHPLGGGAFESAIEGSPDYERLGGDRCK
jgi:hypothetical protein